MVLSCPLHASSLLDLSQVPSGPSGLGDLSQMFSSPRHTSLPPAALAVYNSHGCKTEENLLTFSVGKNSCRQSCRHACAHKRHGQEHQPLAGRAAYDIPGQMIMCLLGSGGTRSWWIGGHTTLYAGPFPKELQNPVSFQCVEM